MDTLACFRDGPGCDLDSFNSSALISCTDGYVYDTEMYLESVVAKFDLVCDQDFKRLILGGVSLLGILLGCLLGGIVADKFGRKNTLAWGVTLTVPQLFLGGYSANYWIYAVLRYYTGFTCSRYPYGHYIY